MSVSFKQLAIYSICLYCMLMVSSCGKDERMFSSLPPEETGIFFANTITETEELNINQYLYAHNGGGVAIGDINNDGLPDIYLTANQLPNKLYLNKGNLKFEDITDRAGVAGSYGPSNWTTGVVMADVDGDGRLDIYVSEVSHYRSFEGVNQLYINNGDLTFTESAEEYGLALKSYSQHATFFDYDLDGDLDMYQLNHSVHNPDVYIRAALRSKQDSLAGDRLFRNDNGKFTDVSGAAGIYGGATGYGLAVAIGDIDNNGCPDIYVSNDFHENDYVYYNNCDGTFREDVRGTLGHCSTFSMGNDIADFNNDGWLDILTLDMKPADEVIRKSSAGPDPYDIFNYKLGFGYFYQYPRNMLHLNRGNLFEKNVQFSEVGQFSGVDATDWSWSVLMADLDNDGWKDIFITNGIARRPIDLDYINFTYNDDVHKNISSLEMAYKMPDGTVSNFAYRNSGELIFEDVSKSWGLDQPGFSMGAAYADLDNDGDLDLVINNLNAPAVVYRSNAEYKTKNNFIKVKLEGDKKNSFGIGARVAVETETGVQMQELNPARGWLSSVDYTVNIGLGKSETISKLTVKWADGTEQVLSSLAVNTTVTVKQSEAKKSQNRDTTVRKLFEEVTNKSGISFSHAENVHVDFNEERLIPHKLSSEGPKMAVADVNNDGLEDFFVGGAFGQAGELYIQKRTDSVFFQRHSSNTFQIDKDYEDIGANFFDADGDGDPDLYVVSGGGQLEINENNQDRLYLNDGTGKFTRSSKALPVMDANGSCVVAADFNNNGSIDLFVGTRSIVGKYGLSPKSFLLWNDGKGIFSLDSTKYALALSDLGMVTGAVWLEDTKELAVVGEWMPITFLKFENDTVEKRELPNTSGWWNTVYASDIDNDGDTDLLLGNVGLNLDLRPSVQEPVRLYVNDYDNNLMFDPVLTYYRQNREWIYLGLDDIKKQIPSIRLRYNKYAEFASHTFSEVFSAASIETAIQKKSQMFQSIYLINEGDGNYAMHDFPKEVQFAPVYSFLVDDFNEDGFKDILAVGNFYGNTPQMGRFDGSYGNYLQGSGKGKFISVEPSQSGFAVYGEARDMKLISTGSSRWIIISRNNVPIRVLETHLNAPDKL